MVSNTAGRRQSTHQVKNTGVRNYYYRNRGNRDSVGGPQHEPQPGFFPAITHFTEAIEGLPKEIVRHFSMLKEVEAKLHAPDEELRRVAEAIEKLARSDAHSHAPVQSFSPSLSSAQNSINGSRNGSIAAPHVVTGQDSQDESGHHERQELFYRLNVMIATAAPVLDEKIALLSTTNQTLGRCLERLESSYLHIPDEVSEEARLGNPKHWAYVTDKETKKTAPERARREVVNHGVNALLAADTEIAHRSESRREAVAAKKSRAQQVDSDFDDKPPPKKGPGKGRKVAVDDAKSVGLGISTVAGAQNKRRKVTGGAGTTPLERSMSGALGGSKAAQTSPRTTPEVGAAVLKKQAKKSGLPPKRRNVGPQSPALASSPIVSSFVPKEIVQKPQTSRGRQSSATALRVTSVENLRGRPSSSASNRPANSMGGLSAIEQLQASAAVADSLSLGPTPVTMDTTDTLKHEDADVVEDTTMSEPAEVPVVATTRAGRQSKTATPMSGSFPSDLALGPRNRSVRVPKEKDNNSVPHSHASSESGERTGGRKKKGASKESTALAPLAPEVANTTPRDTDPDTKFPGIENNDNAENDDTLELEDGEERAEEDEDDEEEEDGNDGEPKYCYCNDVSYGEMVACDNEACAREWFHLKCAGLAKAPDENTKWYCDDCKLKMVTAGQEIKRSRPASRRE